MERRDVLHNLIGQSFDLFILLLAFLQYHVLLIFLDFMNLCGRCPAPVFRCREQKVMGAHRKDTITEHPLCCDAEACLETLPVERRHGLYDSLNAAHALSVIG